MIPNLPLHVVSSLHHPNILPFLGFAIDMEHVTLVLELADKGDLFDYSYKHCTTEVDRARLFHQVYPSILSAVSYLEALQIAHRDIKPENILLKTTKTCGSDRSVSSGGTIQPQLCDFGWSVWYLKSGSRQSTLCGTPEYVPPELLVENAPTASTTSRRSYAAEYVDPWALGVLALEVLRGQTVFGAPTDCPAPQIRTVIYSKICAFDGLDDWLRQDLNHVAISAANHGGILPRTALETWKRSRHSPYVSLIEDFMQPNPCHRLSATECMNRYADLFGRVNLPLPPRPTVRQRRQIFQNKSCAVSSSMLL